MSSYTPHDRIINTVPYPETHRLTTSELFCRPNGLPSIDLLRKHLENQGRLDGECAMKLVTSAEEKFRTESNMIEIQGPVTIVGDIHGQFYDLLTILTEGGNPQNTRYLFLGDYVDRGVFQCECLFLLFALKIKYPHTFFLLRGNHESPRPSNDCSFELECKKKYGSTRFYEACMNAFNSLPICALVNSKFFCVHGGISSKLLSLSDIETIDRVRVIAPEGRLCDLMWADPRKDFDDYKGPDDFIRNPERGYRGLRFSYGACKQFLKNNGLLSVIRAHEMQTEGYRAYRTSLENNFPVMITVFSAPNYCDVYKNLGAFLKVDENRHMKPFQFASKPHPFVLPRYENGFKFMESSLNKNALIAFLGIFNLLLSRDHSDSQNDQLERSLMQKRQIVQNIYEIYRNQERSNIGSLKFICLVPPLKIQRRLQHRSDYQHWEGQIQRLEPIDYSCLEEIYEADVSDVEPSEEEDFE